MLFSIPFNNLLVTPLVGIVTSESVLGTRSQIDNHLNRVIGADPNPYYSNNWAGAVWDEDIGTFTSITGTFTVPTVLGAIGASAAAWVGIDGDTCKTAVLQTGVAFTVESDQPQYSAWYQWYPGPASNFSGIAISAGDVIQLTVNASSLFSGTVTIDNLTNGQTVSKNVTSVTPLCGLNAEWIVEDYMQGTSLVPFANFDVVTFTNALATTLDGTIYTPSHATLFDIKQNNQVLTSTSTSGSSVSIKYV